MSFFVCLKEDYFNKKSAPNFKVQNLYTGLPSKLTQAGGDNYMKRYIKLIVLI